MPTNYLATDLVMERKLLEYIEATASSSSLWWGETYAGTAETRRSRLDRFRLRYDARRSVASLSRDVKTEPFLRSSNVGLGLEQIFGEWLVANCLANTVDLDPPVDVLNPKTRQSDEEVEAFYTDILLHQLGLREVYETLIREVFTVGGAISKWESVYQVHTREAQRWVLVDPETRQPLMQPDPQSGRPVPIEADPETSLESLPLTPTGQRVKVGRLSAVEPVIDPLWGSLGWHPQLRVRTIEQIDAPPTATTADPNTWDYIHETYTVNAWWFLTRQGEMADGRIPKERLARLWQALGVNPDEAYRQPNGALVRPVRVRESHLKFPMTASGEPVELIVLSLPDQHFILSYRLTPFARRPYFNHAVWHRTNFWLGKGIPETLIGLRNALDALLNQDLDAGNLYNQPPLLISSLAGINDESFELAGPGTVWYLRDINGIKFLPPPIRSRDPITMLNWLVGMAQRLWGVTDLNLNAPTSTLSPNIQTAHAVERITQQANIKFGHFIRTIEMVRTRELQQFHQLMGEMWMGKAETVSATGQASVLNRTRLLPFLQVRALGDGVFSNPLHRAQRLVETFAAVKELPEVMADPDVRYEMAQQLLDAGGVSLPIKQPQEMQALRMAGVVVQTPTVQAVLPQAMQEAQAMLEQAQAAQPKPGVSNGRMAMAA